MKPHTHESFGRMHRAPDYYTAKENEGPNPTPRESFQYVLRNIDIVAGRRHNEGSHEAVCRIAYDCIALREALEGLLTKKRGSVKNARRLLQGLDAVQQLSDENWARRKGEAA